MSANAAAGALGVFSVGYADAADGVVANQPANTIELRYTLAGDTNLDGKVDSTDAIAMARNYLVAGKSNWDQGDFNYDGTINYSDALILQKNFNQVLAAPTGASSAVPAGAGSVLAPSPVTSTITTSSDPASSTTTPTNDSTPDAKKKPRKLARSPHDTNHR